MVEKRDIKFVAFFLVVVLASSMVSAGVGLVWSRESALISEGEDTCLEYGVYNPWPDENTYVAIEVTDPLKDVLDLQEIEATLIPENTGIAEAIPIEFCFEIPEKIYEKNCWVGNSFVCEKNCAEDQKVYDGDVVVKSVAPPGGIPGGSVATMAISAPLRLKIDCIPYPRNYALVYIFIAVISALVIFMVLRKKYGRSKEDRLKDKMKALRDEMKSTKKK